MEIYYSTNSNDWKQFTAPLVAYVDAGDYMCLRVLKGKDSFGSILSSWGRKPRCYYGGAIFGMTFSSVLAPVQSSYWRMGMYQVYGSMLLQ